LVILTPCSFLCLQDPPIRSKEPKQKWEVEEREKDAGGDADLGPKFRFDSLQKEDSESDFWRRQEEKYKRDQDNQAKKDDDQARFQQQRSQMQRDFEERERAERDRREADERDRKEREKSDREDRERRDREDRERREREDRDRKEREDRERREREDRERREKQEREDRERREKEEKERKVREERERLDNDPSLQEQRRKKEELLKRLQQIDANRDGSQPDADDPFAPSDSTRSRNARGDDPFGASPSRRRSSKDLFITRPGSDESGSKKDYVFTRSIENMHQGKPARNDVSVPYIDRQKKMKAAKEDAEIGGYQPSFVPSSKPPPSSQKKPLSLFDDEPKARTRPPAGDKKSKLMADLFGPGASTTADKSGSKLDDSEEFFIANKTKSNEQAARRSTGFPWDSSANASPSKTNGAGRPESSTLFGGGAALVEDEAGGSNKSNLLPKRHRQPSSTLSSKPAVVAVDNFDDDIEEVIL
jgi:hypothetical protein